MDYEYYLGEIILFGGNYAPQGWAFCDGRQLKIAENEALYSLIGVTYGGDARTTFNIPDLRGKAVAGYGDYNNPKSPEQQTFIFGQTYGSENITLTEANMPVHSHNMIASASNGTFASPENAFLANTLNSNGEVVNGFITPQDAVNAQIGFIAQEEITSAGNSQPHDNMQSYIALNYMICLQGIYPFRS